MSRKFKSYRKYNYNEGGGKAKKIILISLAVVLVLVLAVVIAAILLLGGSGSTDAVPTFTIQSLPDKTTYYVGDTPNWIGFQAVLTTAQGNAVTLSASNCKITGFDSSKPADNQVILVQYKEYTASFTISILDPSDKPVDKQFTGKMSFKTLY